MAEKVVDMSSLLRGSHLNKIADLASPVGDDAWRPQPLSATSPNYALVRQMLSERLARSRHSFRLVKVETTTAPRNRRAIFSSLLRAGGSRPDSLLLVFHGTKTENHESILRDGFLEEKFGGATDEGYVGQGVYTSPDPEYALSYIEEAGVVRYKYTDPVQKTGTEVKLLAVLVAPGRSQFVTAKSYGQELPGDIDSRCAWVSEAANPVDSLAARFATELVVAKPSRILPKFVLTLVKVDHEVVWLDPNGGNAENAGYARQLHQKATNMHLYSVSDEAAALEILKRPKKGTSRRLITAGSSGKSLLEKFCAAGIPQCPAMVFCGSPQYHKTWASKYSFVRVTSSAAEFMAFCIW